MEFGNTLNSIKLKSVAHTINQQLINFRLKISCCLLCGNDCQTQLWLCQFCQADLPYFNYQHLPYDLLTWPAMTKLIPRNNFDHLIAIAPYVWPFNTWISQLKYQYKTELAELLSQLLIHHWHNCLSVENANLTPANTAVISVPLHIKKWQTRGFNQAHLIALKFAEKFQYPYHANAVTREKCTENQVGKSGLERRKNLKNAFSVNLEKINDLPKNIILIDDVVTTGTTANEICKILKKKGVQHITLLSICIAIPVG